MTLDLHMLKQKNKKVDNYSLRSSPMIRGKVVDFKEAISEIKRILKSSSSVHIDGMDCDVSSIDEALSNEGVPPPKNSVSNFQGALFSLKNKSISKQIISRNSGISLFLSATE